MPDETFAAQTDTSAADGNNQDQSGNDQSKDQGKNQDQSKDQTANNQNNDQSSGDGNKADKLGEDQGGAPEAYADFTLPEGVKIDEALMGEFTPLAKELNLNQGQAQKLVDFHSKSIEQAIGSDRVNEAVQAAQQEIVKAQTAQWLEGLKADKAIGGGNLDATRVGVGKVMNRFGNDAFRAVLNETGIGNNVEFVRAFSEISKHISEDVFLNKSSSGSGETEDVASIMYPNEVKK